MLRVTVSSVPATRSVYGEQGLARIDRKARESTDWHKAGQRGKRKAGPPQEGEIKAPGSTMDGV